MPVFSMQVPIYCKHAENRAFGNLYGISVLEPSFDFDLDKKEGHGCQQRHRLASPAWTWELALY